MKEKVYEAIYIPTGMIIARGSKGFVTWVAQRSQCIPFEIVEA